VLSEHILCRTSVTFVVVDCVFLFLTIMSDISAEVVMYVIKVSVQNSLKS